MHDWGDKMSSPNLGQGEKSVPSWVRFKCQHLKKHNSEGKGGHLIESNGVEKSGFEDIVRAFFFLRR